MNQRFNDDEIKHMRNITKHSLRNRNEILNSTLCGCYHCRETFPPYEIDEWWDERESDAIGETAVCPRCGIDSVIGNASGYEPTPALLQRLMEFSF